MTAERREGLTPSGGAYAVAFYSDERGVSVEKERATRVTITEYDEDGERIAETHGDLVPERTGGREFR